MKHQKEELKWNDNRGQRSSSEVKGQERAKKVFLQAKMANSNEILKEGKKGNDK